MKGEGMAESLAHTFGQIIGNILERAVEPGLQKFAVKHGLYLDKKGTRNAREGKKVSWTDLYGNVHDLDFVLERGGTQDVIGTPVAFIETAWRRYTKHSRNKAQEIQGAVQVLALTHKYYCPFIAAILAGVFTEGAINQLRSLGFRILYFPYESIVEAFRSVGIDASFDEKTPEKEFRKKIRQWSSLAKRKQEVVSERLVRKHQEDTAKFFDDLKKTVNRIIAKIIIIVLHGAEAELPTVAQAIAYLASYQPSGPKCDVYKYEIQIRYNNGDRIAAEFKGKEEALDFLNKYL